MDTRTTNLLRALDGTSLEILAALLENPLSEKSLVRVVKDATQPTIHKKLQKLEEVGLIKRPPFEGKRGLPWSVVAPQASANLLRAVLLLSEALDSADQQVRQGLLKRLDESSKPALRVVKE
jgi:DNA-binding transcriptional ArsR family regulator